MTTIAGLHLPGVGTWIAGDRMLTSGDTKMGPVSKLAVGPDLWATATAGEYHTIALMQEERATLFKGLTDPVIFVKRLKRAMYDQGYRPSLEEAGAPLWGRNSILLAHPTGLWEFDNTLSLYRVPDGVVWACGSGREYALGAGHALRAISTDIDPAVVLRMVIDAAREFDNATGFDAEVHWMLVSDLNTIMKPRAKPGKKKTGAKKSR